MFSLATPFKEEKKSFSKSFFLTFGISFYFAKWVKTFRVGIDKISYKTLMNILRMSCEHIINVLLTSYEHIINVLLTYYEHIMTVLRMS